MTTPPDLPDSDRPETLPVASPGTVSAAMVFLGASRPLDLPRPDPDIARMGCVERSAEALRYALLRLEYFVSPDGMLRRWNRLVLRLAAFLAVPALVLVPLTLLFLEGVADSVALLGSMRGLLGIGLLLLAVQLVRRASGGR